ncbi:hypothetical protein DOY81_014718 [Sarcophaga bullata]|nr:hypothetical protein DOY81_014718 [Sarcophaga bullata]
MVYSHISSKNFDLFYNNNNKTIHFFYEAFSVELKNSTTLILYQTLQTILNELESEDKLNIITNFLYA